MLRKKINVFFLVIALLTKKDNEAEAGTSLGSKARPRPIVGTSINIVYACED